MYVCMFLEGFSQMGLNNECSCGRAEKRSSTGTQVTIASACEVKRPTEGGSEWLGRAHHTQGTHRELGIASFLPSRPCARSVLSVALGSSRRSIGRL
ncbi:uncharacterized protein BDZ83DRAFT_645597 [Colletotrichum acutatum]|uniref:Uncharacterized protein n=1 Tax=Glomerella acutata TaxID=27357 RepID=A0AAD8X8K9_GLOAC|nr:uncharacterized protein BDZ83DRAFT_645597 [Colletotrichum acutatum]KAK1701635.1 hypothetical protein BDZ83DRAFT_645597 [Colletotrichum acutatum]